MNTTSITINEVLNFISIATPSELARIKLEVAAHEMAAEQTSRERHPSNRTVGVPYVPASVPKSTVPGATVEIVPLLSVGDTVQVTGDISPRYMMGQVGVIEKVNQTRVKVKFGENAGRFSNKVVHVPMGVLTRVS
jgi:hypothetical protein